MKRAFVLVLLSSGLASPLLAQTPEQIVQRNRDRFGATVSPQEAPVLLQAIAADLTQTLGTPYGLLPKTSGNQCGGFACDIICSASFHWDVLHDGPDAAVNYSGAATPEWLPKGAIAGCALSPQAPPIAPLPPSPLPVISDLGPLLRRLDELAARIGAPPSDSVYAQNERTYADLTNQHKAQTADLKAAIDNPGWFATVFGNRYVQLALAAVGTYVATEQMKK